MNPLKRKIGILGGGQLGRMMIEESLRMNLDFSVLEADASCPCAGISNRFVLGSLLDEVAIRELASEVDVLSYEIEHVNTDALKKLEAEGVEVIPSPAVLEMIQDKGLQKEFFVRNGIPTSEFRLVESPQDWIPALEYLPGDRVAAKTRKGGYDGKGVALLTKNQVSERVPFESPCVLEAFVPCQKELAVIVARDRQGNCISYPTVEMEFDPDANLVTFLVCPAHISDELEEQARNLALKTVEAMKSPGLFAVEMFLTSDNRLLVNEIAPRVHNSGHHTIEACYTSQFEQLVRILAGMPLGSTELISPAVMMNVLGGPGFNGPYQIDGLDDALSMEGVYLHLYGKKESKPMRKMGHITVLGETPSDAHAKAVYLQNRIKLIAE
ncbi:MAG: 5-(carboxyamino)imidazole ribonucleotide synthase [Bacteroidia bacterium]|nr:5-(carboxyamino)imidazole ribonucleotide synthase [Bacteroidia bacterium]